MKYLEGKIHIEDDKRSNRMKDYVTLSKQIYTEGSQNSYYNQPKSIPKEFQSNFVYDKHSLFPYKEFSERLKSETSEKKNSFEKVFSQVRESRKNSESSYLDSNFRQGKKEDVFTKESIKY